MTPGTYPAIIADMSMHDMPPSPPLPYPRRDTSNRDAKGRVLGIASEEYDIPEDRKTAVLYAMFPFVDCPGLDEYRIDNHNDKRFRVGDFKVVRELGQDYLVSPYYYDSGATVIDWRPVKR